MKATELIQHLVSAVQQHGDMLVKLNTDQDLIRVAFKSHVFPEFILDLQSNPDDTFVAELFGAAPGGSR